MSALCIAGAMTAVSVCEQPGFVSRYRYFSYFRGIVYPPSSRQSTTKLLGGMARWSSWMSELWRVHACYTRAQCAPPPEATAVPT